jgi:glutamate-ammonia-ligase adenylyltransferase
LKQPAEAYRTLLVLAQGPEFVHTSSRTKILFSRLWPVIREQLPREARPDLCLNQLERFTEAYGTRSALFETLLRRPKLLEILFLIFDNSRYLTDTIIRHPEFIEDIALTGTLDYQKTPEDVAHEIRAMVEAGLPLEKVLRLAKRSELLRIELRAMMGKAGLDVTMQEWSELAEVCLGESATAAGAGGDFAIIAMGKFGGKELSNGSDLDVMFVGENLKTPVRILKLMTETTEDGIVFPMDARLRPYGNDGLLSVPIATYQEYYADHAQFWEKLALTRARPVAGNPELRAQFEALIAKTIYHRPVSAAELAEIFDMRGRIEKERSTHSTDFNADYKTGSGGLVDLEFMAQTLQLLNGSAKPEWRATNTLGILKLHGDPQLSDNYLFLRKMEFSLRRFHLTEESSIPRDEEQRWILARHMGFKDFESFLKVYGPVLKENRRKWEEFKVGVGGKA